MARCTGPYENGGDGLVPIDAFGRTEYIGNIDAVNLYGLLFHGNPTDFQATETS